MKLQLAMPDRTPGSYNRQPATFAGDALYSYYRHSGVMMTLPVRGGLPMRVTDDLTEQMLADGLIMQDQKAEMEALVAAQLGTPELLERYDHASIEEMYEIVADARRKAYGTEVLERARQNAMRKAAAQEGMIIDQRAKKYALIAERELVLFALCDASLYAEMEKDITAVQRQGKQAYVLADRQCGGVLPPKKVLECLTGNIGWIETDGRTAQGSQELQSEIERGDAVLLVYGEEGLLQCRRLILDAVVTAVPTGFYAQATVNQMDGVRPCCVYVPKGFDITKWTPIRDRTQMSYWHLARLWADFGDHIYDDEPEKLMRKYPQYFLNAYQNGSACAEADAGFPMRVVQKSGETYEAARERTIGEFINSLPGVRYASQLFADGQQGILAHTVRIDAARNAQVIKCPKNVSPRAMFSENETGMISNFLFFMTPKLAALYNSLRSDRPYEQADAASGHLDYMLCYRDGQRIETFPLFRKSCIALKENGEFLFFNFRLGGGKATVGGITLRWSAGDVDGISNSPVCVYTPYLSMQDEDADRNVYRRVVGEGRVNLVILQDRICSVRRGDVMLPSVGVVISLTEEAAHPILQQLQPLEDGYYDASALDLTVHLDAPQGIDEDTWAKVQWAYGGGLTLMLEGEGLCDGDNLMRWMREEGWMSPLSRQTQESSLHTLTKHPRTAIGVTQSGALVIIVYSGRSKHSSGADYREMIDIARQLYPDIRTLMNADGGGSAVLGLAVNGSFLELSLPAASTDSCVGMVRPINTVLYLAAEKE